MGTIPQRGLNTCCREGPTSQLWKRTEVMKHHGSCTAGIKNKLTATLSLKCLKMWPIWVVSDIRFCNRKIIWLLGFRLSSDSLHYCLGGRFDWVTLQQSHSSSVRREAYSFLHLAFLREWLNKTVSMVHRNLPMKTAYLPHQVDACTHTSWNKAHRKLTTPDVQTSHLTVFFCCCFW